MNETPQTHFLKTQVSKPLISFTVIMAVLYFFILTFWFPRGNVYIFWALIAGELYHLWQVGIYCWTVWNTEHLHELDASFQPPVDVFITVAGEPVEIVEETARAAKAMKYPNFNVYLLNDGFVAGKDNWKDIEDLAQKLGISCITRKTPGGAKAGNINHALSLTSSPFVTVFDADHVPHADFLQKMVGHFADTKVAFVQSPQYYKNFALNEVTHGAWEQQELFFGAIMKGKSRFNATFMCGTNMVMRRSALVEVGGMCETNIAEDFLTSLFIHEQGWKSVYVPEVLAEGLAPEDFLSYYKQQFRWARGSLEIVFRHNPFFKDNLTFSQKIQYFSSSSYYLSGIIALMNALLPVIFFYTGLVPLQISTMSLSAVFLPYILLNLYTLQLSSNFTYTYRALAFSISSFALHIQALTAIATNQKTKFAVTSKTQISGNFPRFIVPHLLYIVIAVVGVGVAIHRDGATASVINNAAWAFLNAAIFIPFISAAVPGLRLFAHHYEQQQAN